MYILVHHRIRRPDRFWPVVQDADIPNHLTLHQSIPARDGTRATCVWEAESVEAVRQFVEPLVGQASDNEYNEAVNGSGVAMPTALTA